MIPTIVWVWAFEVPIRTEHGCSGGRGLDLTQPVLGRERSHHAPAHSRAAHRLLTDPLGTFSYP